MLATTASLRHHPIAAVRRAPRSRARARSFAPGLTNFPDNTQKVKSVEVTDKKQRKVFDGDWWLSKTATDWIGIATAAGSLGGAAIP